MATLQTSHQVCFDSIQKANHLSGTDLFVIQAIMHQISSEVTYEHCIKDTTTIDPACGSGHFLLGAARRLGERLAGIRRDGDEPSPDDKRMALRDVIRSCIYGVDLNPMSVELCKVGLWMESMQPGLPLSFLDAHIRCGNSLVGVGPRQKIMDLRVPDNAFDPKTGDDKTTSARLKKQNKAEYQQMAFTLIRSKEELSSHFLLSHQMEEMPENSAAAVRAKKDAFNAFEASEEFLRSKDAADLWTAAFFWKMKPVTTALNFPTQGVLYNLQHGKTVSANLVDSCRNTAEKVNAFHWPLMFPSVYSGTENDGFDVILGNPPWEKIKLQEVEYFAERDPDIAAAKNKAERERMIKALDKTNPALKAAFEEEKHRAECTSKFMRFGTRLPLTAQGDMNLYALFAETNRQLMNKNGSAGFIVPSGIVSDDGTKEFFADLVETKQLYSVYDFENSAPIFPGVHRSYKFSLMTLSGREVEQTEFVFFAHRTEDLNDPQRRFSLTAEEIARFNPNTHTMPIFRTKIDAELNKKIYSRLPILINEETGENPWQIQFSRMLDMSNDSHLFSDTPGPGKLRLYEAKYFHHYDHRWATYEGGNNPRELTLAEKQDPDFTVQTRYYVKQSDVAAKVPDFWKHKWFLAFRNITNVTNERSSIFSFVPYVGIGHSAPLIYVGETALRSVQLVSCVTSLPYDYFVRQKLGGTNMTYGYLRQFPIPSPYSYSQEDLCFILSHAFELVYTTNDLKPFAEDLWNESSEELRQVYRRSGFDPQTMAPFTWDEDRRALLRAELDAYYARLYGLTRDELRYILDPQDVYGPDFPGETFRVLKDNETAKYGEYRTRRLVLEAWDRIEADLGPIDPSRFHGDGYAQRNCSPVSGKSSTSVSRDGSGVTVPGGNTTAKSGSSASQSNQTGFPRSVTGTASAGTAGKPSKGAAWGSPAKSRSTQAPLFLEDEGSPQPSLFTPAGPRESSVGAPKTSGVNHQSPTGAASSPKAYADNYRQPSVGAASSPKASTGASQQPSTPSASKSSNAAASVPNRSTAPGQPASPSGTKGSFSAQSSSGSKSSSSAAVSYPAADNYKLFKCSVCGRIIAGFSRPAHEKSHPGRKVEWKKM